MQSDNELDKNPVPSKNQSSLLSSLSLATTIQQLLDRGHSGTLITLLEPSKEIDTIVGTKVLIDELGQRTGSFGDSQLDEAINRFGLEFLASRNNVRMVEATEFVPELPAWQAAKFLFERIEVESKIVICGAGHVGAALATLSSFAGYNVVLIDDRAEFVARERFTEERIELIVATDWSEAVLSAIGIGKGVAVAIVTRGHNEDEKCLRAAMNTEPDYVGMIGSKRRTRIVLDRLREAGFNEEKLERVHAPIGLDIGAVTPEEVALAILAEMIAVRRGGKGLPLSLQRRSG
ncbi:MAG TPA: XdhC family protein [Pyrinomonadaceae bacterium]